MDNDFLTGVKFSDLDSFVQKLNSFTNRRFMIPSSEELNTAFLLENVAAKHDHGDLRLGDHPRYLPILTKTMGTGENDTFYITWYKDTYSKPTQGWQYSFITIGAVIHLVEISND
ncbi:MAG: hypothetical protein ABIH69_01550 [bacterium]